MKPLLILNSILSPSSGSKKHSQRFMKACYPYDQYIYMSSNHSFKAFTVSGSTSSQTKDTFFAASCATIKLALIMLATMKHVDARSILFKSTADSHMQHAVLLWLGGIIIILPLPFWSHL